VKAMNALRGMKLCYQDRDTTKAWTATIRVIYTHFTSVPDPEPDPDPLVRGMDPDPALDPDPSIIM
jgi:hypothetical protein